MMRPSLFSKLSIRKLLLSFSVCFVFIFSLISLIIFHTTSDLLEDNTAQTATRISDTALHAVSGLFESATTLANFLSLHSNTTDYFTNYSARTDQEWHDLMKESYIAAINQYYDVHSIGIFQTDGSTNLHFGKIRDHTLYQTAQLSPQIVPLQQTTGGNLWIPPYQLNYSSYRLFSYQTQLYSTTQFDLTGYLTVNIRVDQLIAILDQFRETGEFALVDADGAVLAYGSNVTDVSPFQHAAALFKTTQTGSLQQLGGHDYFLNFATIPQTDWFLVSLIPFDGLRNELLQIQYIILFSLLIGIIVVTVFSLVLSQKISTPILALTRRMDSMDQRTFRTPFHDHSYREMTQLSDGFNNMIRDIDELLVKNYEYKIIEQDIRMEILQAKLSPHFLYNALETIDSMVILGESQKASALITGLSDLLRYSISEAKGMTTLEAELEQTRNYLELQKARFGERFQYDFDVDYNLLSCRMLKMLLQPIVENALVHGLENRVANGRLTILAKPCDDGFHLAVVDNGVGIDPAVMAQLDHDMQQGYSENNHHIGVRNVSHRIQIKYGAPYGLTFDTSSNGTTVTIHLPNNPEE